MDNSMMCYSPERFAELEALTRKIGVPAESKKMFGHSVLFLNTHMYCGGNEKGYFVHLPLPKVAELVESGQGRPFEPRLGMVMREYVQLAPETRTTGQLESLLAVGAEYLQGLGAKVKKGKKGC